MELRHLGNRLGDLRECVRLRAGRGGRMVVCHVKILLYMCVYISIYMSIRIDMTFDIYIYIYIYICIYIYFFLYLNR